METKIVQMIIYSQDIYLRDNLLSYRIHEVMNRGKYYKNQSGSNGYCIGYFQSCHENSRWADSKIKTVRSPVLNFIEP